MSNLIDNYSKEELEKIVLTSFSYAEVLSRLGYGTVHGHNSRTLKKRIKYYEISTEHFSYKPKKHYTEEEIFCENSSVSQNKLRKTFKEKAVVEYRCAICGLYPIWNGKPLVLTLDHKNGKNKDNRIENLQWVCPNCDRQSPTYGTRNKKDLHKDVILYNGNYSKTQEEAERAVKEKQDKDSARVQTIKKDDHYYCIDCGKEISSNASKCIQCASKDRQKEICVSKEELLTLLQLHKGNFTHIGKMFNVSDNAVRKWCKKYGLPTHSYDYRGKKPPRITNPKSDQYKPCYMIDKETNMILMEFKSRSAAEEYLKIPKAAIHIAHVCEGKRASAYGYKWKFE